MFNDRINSITTINNITRQRPMATYKPWMALVDISRKVRWTLESEGIRTYGFTTLLLVFRHPSCCCCNYMADGEGAGRVA